MSDQVQTRKTPVKRKEISRHDLVAMINQATAEQDPVTAHRIALSACGKYIAANDVTQALAAHLRVHGS